MTRREEVAEALWLHLAPGARSWPPPQQSLTDVYLETADALLPTVDRLRAEAAADELDQVADNYAGSRSTWPIADALRARASALRAAHPTTSEETDRG